MKGAATKVKNVPNIKLELWVAVGLGMLAGKLLKARMSATKAFLGFQEIVNTTSGYTCQVLLGWITKIIYVLTS